MYGLVCFATFWRNKKEKKKGFIKKIYDADIFSNKKQGKAKSFMLTHSITIFVEYIERMSTGTLT